MKRLILPFALTPILVLIMAFKPTTTTTVEFAESNWESLQTLAQTEGKLFFVDFDASYCATCRNMDQSTYMSEQLANYMSQNVIASRIDVQDFDGVMWAQNYEVEALPTMLIFNEKGKLVKRLVGYQSASKLMAEFGKARASQPSVKPTPEPIAPDEPMPSPTPEPTPQPQPDVTVTTTTTPSGSTVTTTTTTTGSLPVDAPLPTGKGLYEISVNKQSSEGFAVQVGVFSSYESILEAANKFKRMYSKKTIMHVDEHKGVVVYKLLLGTFSNKREATYFRNDLRRDNTVGLIKDLALMK